MANTTPPRLPAAPVRPDRIPIVERVSVVHLPRPGRRLTVSKRVYVGHKSEVGTITSLVEESHASDKTEHGWLMVGVLEANSDKEEASDNTDKVYPGLLSPQGVCVLVDDVANKATRWPSNDVEKTEHSCPPTATSLTEVREILEIVGAKDGVDGELTAERAEVRSRKCERLK